MKKTLVKLDQYPQGRGENKENLSIHHLVLTMRFVLKPSPVLSNRNCLSLHSSRYVGGRLDGNGGNPRGFSRSRNGGPLTRCAVSAEPVSENNGVGKHHEVLNPFFSSHTAVDGSDIQQVYNV